jgi:hypothetical protein
MRRILVLLSTMVLAMLLAGGLALVAVSPAARADGDCQPSGSDVVCTFTYTGNAQSWTVPEGVTQATFDVSGAQGGGTPGGDGVIQGGKGGEATATIPVTPGDTLQVNVGGKGGDGDPNGPGGAGGFNGGAAGGVGCCSGPGGGGGASDVRRDTDASGDFALAERIIVAGGGGGTGGFAGGAGGVGGGLSGADGGTTGLSGADGGGGGTQEDGGDGGLGQVFDEQVFGDNGSKGDLGDGGEGGEGISIGDGGGGGGGGYYGGGGGGGGISGGGGGGGSGFGPSGVVFDSGVRSGDGLVTITYTTPVDTTPPTVTDTSPPREDPPPNNVSKTATVTATFSEEVQNVSTETFFLERKISVKKAPPKFERVAATVDLINGIYVLDPVQDLPKGEYRATITTDVTDMADPANALEDPVVWTFTVAK